MSFALSTSWNAFRHCGGKQIVSEIKSAGFDQIELSFSLDKKITRDIARLVKKGLITVTSAHNFCPIPDKITREKALPDYYSLASVDNEERKKAVEFTKRGIEYCSEINARALVLHLGRVEVEDDTRLLIQMLVNGESNSPRYSRMKSIMRQNREIAAKNYFPQALLSLDELSAYAAKFNIALGIENRFYFREIPTFEELNVIIPKFNNTSIFYWHDTGHAAIMEQLGFIDSAQDYLKLTPSRLLGMHLHDVKNGQDHLAPSSGKLDFAALKPFITDSTLKVIEAHYPATRQEIINARIYLEKIFSSI